MRDFSPWRSVGLFLLLAALVLSACGTPQRSTRLTHADMNDVVEHMRQSLAASDFLRERGPESPRAVIVIDRVENLTGDLITPAEQWMMVARLQGAMPIQTLCGEKNVAFQLPPERIAALRDAGYDGPLPPPMETPTHVMWATFRSADRAARLNTSLTDARAEYYYFEYRINALPARSLAWTDSFVIKREAMGVTID